MNKGELALNYFNSGYNCCQSVVLAFKDELNIDEDVLKKLSISFGGGLGRQRLTCGAVSGMCMVLGGLLSDGKDKLANYSIVQKACAMFKEETGSIICSELLDAQSAKDTNPKPEERTKAYYKKRPCGQMCKLAAQIVQELLNDN